MSADSLNLILSALVIVTTVALLSRLDRGKRRVFSCLKNSEPLPLKVLEIRSFANKHVGLLNHIGLVQDSGLLFIGAKSIHTRGMLFPIDVLFLDAQGRVLAIDRHLAPDVMRHKGPAPTKNVLELPAGEARRLKIERGDRLVFLT